MTSRVIMGPDYYPSPTTNAPIDFGYIYVGEPDLDPAIPANQKTLSVLQEDGNIVPVAQPVRTNAFGIPEYNGSVATLVVDGPYSLRVNNRLGVKEYLIPNSFNEAENSALFGGRPPSDYRLTGDIIPESEGGTGTDTFETAPFNIKSKNGSDIPNKTTFRTNIGLSPGAIAQATLGFGSTVLRDIGTAPDEVPLNSQIGSEFLAQRDGYWKDNASGIIIQWGVTAGKGIYTLPIPFPNNFWVIVNSINLDRVNVDSGCTAYVRSLSEFSVFTGDNSAGHNWIAIGN